MASAVWKFTRPLRWATVVAWCASLGLTLTNEGRIRAECEHAGGSGGECLRQEREDWDSATTVALEGAAPLAALGGAFVLVRRRRQG